MCVKNYWVVDFEREQNAYKIYHLTLECTLDDDTTRILHFFESKDEAERYVQSKKGN